MPEDGTYRIFTYDGFNRSKRGQYDLSLICLTPICDCVEPDCEISRQPPLVLIYAVLDNNLGDDPDNLERLINNAEAGVHDDVRVRLLIDTPGGDGSIIYDLMHDTDPSCPKVGNLTCSGRYVEGENFWRNGDEDTAHPETLYNFVVDAAKTYSDTEKILLSLVGHGSGWSANALPGQPSKWGSQPGEQPNHEERLGGFLWDDTPGDGGTSRSMSTKALGVALDWIKNEIGRPIDLLYLDACSMGMASVAYEVRNSVDYLLASPNTAWASFNYAKMLQETTPDKNAEAIGLAWLEAEAQVLRREQYPFTLSLYNLSKMEEVATAISTMADTLQAAMPGNKTQITQAGAQTERFESNYDGSIATSDHYADQLSFVLHLEEAFSTNDAVKRAVQSTKTALAAFIVKQELHSGKPWLYPPNVWRWQEAGGFSIYLPLEEDDPKRALYTSANLQWAQDTHWDEFLNAYWGGVMLSANANSDVLPTCPSTTDCGPLNKLLPLQPTIYLPLIHQ
ncbi:MAG: clostripain-related cysteine peptidase [Caldilineaceae bacterium]